MPASETVGPEGGLPPPFPVFEQWTRFNEDELFD